MSLVETSVVFGNPLFVLHENFHTELFLLSICVGFFWKKDTFLDFDPEFSTNCRSKNGLLTQFQASFGIALQGLYNLPKTGWAKLLFKYPSNVPCILH